MAAKAGHVDREEDHHGQRGWRLEMGGRSLDPGDDPAGVREDEKQEHRPQERQVGASLVRNHLAELALDGGDQELDGGLRPTRAAGAGGS